MLMFTLCDAGDGCLIPAPYFTGYDGDLADPVGRTASVL